MNEKIVIKQFNFFKKLHYYGIVRGYELMVNIGLNNVTYFRISIYKTQYTIEIIENTYSKKDEKLVQLNDIDPKLIFKLANILELKHIIYYRFCFNIKWKEALCNYLLKKRRIVKNIELTIDLINTVGWFYTFEQISLNTYHINGMEITLKSNINGMYDVSNIISLEALEKQEKYYNKRIKLLKKYKICTELSLSFTDLSYFTKVISANYNIVQILYRLKNVPKPNLVQTKKLRGTIKERTDTINELTDYVLIPYGINDKYLLRTIAKILIKKNY